MKIATFGMGISKMKKFLKFLPLLFCLSAYPQATGASYYSSATLTSTTQLLAAPGNNAFGSPQKINIVGFTIQIQQNASPVNWGLISGTGSNCATNTKLVTPAYLGYASIQQSIGQSYSVSLPTGVALCFYVSGVPIGAVVNVAYTIG